MTKRAIGLIIAVITFIGASGQIHAYRTEFIPFDSREDAVAGNTSRIEHFQTYTPSFRGTSGDVQMYGEMVNIPVKWSDYNIYIHIENTCEAYGLAVNNKIIATCEDPYTPHDFMISQFLGQGTNEIILLLRKSEFAALDAGIPVFDVKRFDGCYIYAQYKAHVYDYSYNIAPDEKGNVRLNMKVVLENNFSYDEKVMLGYDVYDPTGKVVDFGTHEVKIFGKDTATEEISAPLGDIRSFVWSASNPQLYRVMLFINRDGKPREYIPFTIGVGRTKCDKGRIFRNGKEIKPSIKRYNCSSKNQAEKDIAQFLKDGFNTVLPDVPQPEWFYDLCDAKGMYVLDRANINPIESSQNRTKGGTPSNDPNYKDQYMERVKGMYYRACNHVCIIGFVLAGERAGNGYNMYKVYEWMKAHEQERAVICLSADGEWNTDIDNL